MKKIAIFSYDAGSSEILKALYKKYKKHYIFQLYVIPYSPFDKISKDIKDKTNVDNNRENIYEKLDKFCPELIIYGTSWQIKTHEVFLEYANKNSIKSIAFLDHWVFYKERFSSIFPDFIATFDNHSTKVAKSLDLPNVVQIKNYYFENLKNKYSSMSRNKKKQILFLSEPTSKVALKRFGDEKYWGFDESDIYLEVLNFSKKLNMSLLTRLHPSDSKEKYLNFDIDTNFSNNSLLEDIAVCDIIIGIDTVALYIAYFLGEKAIAFMPTKKREVTIPIPKENITDDLYSFKISSIKTKDTDIFDNSIEFDEFLKKEFK